MSVVTYKPTTDCHVFGRFRPANKEFKGPAWDETYEWAMPDHLEVVGAQGEAQAPAAPKEPKAPATPKPPKAPAKAPEEPKAPAAGADLG